MGNRPTAVWDRHRGAVGAFTLAILVFGRFPRLDRAAWVSIALIVAGYRRPSRSPERRSTHHAHEGTRVRP